MINKVREQGQRKKRTVQARAGARVAKFQSQIKIQKEEKKKPRTNLAQ